MHVQYNNINVWGCVEILPSTKVTTIQLLLTIPLVCETQEMRILEMITRDQFIELAFLQQILSTCNMK